MDFFMDFIYMCFCFCTQIKGLMKLLCRWRFLSNSIPGSSVWQRLVLVLVLLLLWLLLSVWTVAWQWEHLASCCVTTQT